MVVERRDGSRAVFSVFKDGASYRILADGDGEPTLVSRGRTVEAELRIVYHAKLVSTSLPWQGHPSLG